MPDNTWFTPYKIPASKCLSLGPSQGIVYQLTEHTVIKLPFQYEVNRALDPEEAKEKIDMSLRSCALFRKESLFYDLLAKQSHSNLAQRLQSRHLAIVLPYYQPLELVWSKQSKDTRFAWIQQLLSALEWLENLGYTHGDLQVRNMGIDINNQLQLFDFGSVMQRDKEGFDEQVLEDHFFVATCIHYLASGENLVAKATSHSEVKRTLEMLKTGQGTVKPEAKEFEEVIQAGWTGAATTFSLLCKTVTDIVQQSSSNKKNGISANPQLYCDDVALEQDTRWLCEEDYRAARMAEGFDIPEEDCWC